MSIISGSPQLNGNPLVEQQARLKLKKALLAEQARRTAEGMGIAPTGQMVSGHYVAPSIGEHLAKLGQKYVETRNVREGEKEVAGEEGTLRQQIEAAAAAAMEQGRDKQVPFQAPGIDEADAAAASQGARTTQKGDRVGAGRALSQLPGYEQIGSQLMSDALINEPIRAEAKLEKRQDREDRQAAAAEALKAQLQQRQEEIAARLEQQGLDRASREALQRESMELRRDMMQLAAAERAAARADRAAARPEAKETPAQQRMREANDVLSVLDMATTAPKGGKSLIERGTSSGIGSVRDAVLAAVGGSTEAGDAAAELAALEGRLVSLMPKMSGPQSDKDVLLYKQMAGKIGDPKVPVSQKQAAAKTIRQLNEKYAGIQPAPRTSPASTPAADADIGDLINRYRTPSR